jgi:hypothetical protein
VVRIQLVVAAYFKVDATAGAGASPETSPRGFAVSYDRTDQTSIAAAVTRLVADDGNGVGPVARRSA